MNSVMRVLMALAALAAVAHYPAVRGESDGHVEEAEVDADGEDEAIDAKLDAATVANSLNKGSSGPAVVAPPAGPNGEAPPAAAAVALSQDAASDAWEPRYVNLTAAEYDAFLEREENVLVYIAAYKCGACRAFEREWQRASWLGERVALPVKFARVDAPANEAVMERLKLTGVPAFFLYTNYGKERYQFPLWWAGEAVVAALQKRLSLHPIAPVRELQDISEVSAWLFSRANDQGTFRPTVVIYTPLPMPFNFSIHQAVESCRRPLEAAARLLVLNEEVPMANRPRFAIVSNPAVLAAFQLPRDRASIILYKDFDDGKAIFSQPSCNDDVDRITNWIVTESTPRATIGHHVNLRDIKARENILVHVFVPEATLDDRRAYDPVLGSLQELHKSLEAEGLFERADLTFVVSNGQRYAGWVKDYGLETGLFPAIGMDVPARKRRYAMANPEARRYEDKNTTAVAEEAVNPDLAPTPGPNGLLPTTPVDPLAIVEVDAGRVAAFVRGVLRRELEHSVDYRPAAKIPEALNTKKAAKRGAKSRKASAAKDDESEDAALAA